MRDRRARCACRAFPELRKFFDCDVMARARSLDCREFLSQMHRDMREQEERRNLEAPEFTGDARAIALARIRRL
eukprot:1470410-Pyramimonas_sp.AAC.1